MKKSWDIVLFIPFLLLFSCNSQPESATEITMEAAYEIAWQLVDYNDFTEDFHIAVLPFIDSDTDESNKFSDYFADELTSALFEEIDGDAVIMERSQIKQLLEEAKFASTGLISEETAVRMGEMIGADAVIIGTFRSVADVLRINARFVSIESGRINGVANMDIPLEIYSSVTGD